MCNTGQKGSFHEGEGCQHFLSGETPPPQPIHRRLESCVSLLNQSQIVQKNRKVLLVAILWTRIGARWAIQIGAENCDDFDSFAVCVSVSL